jgi:curved DNA-binding protein CbpA
MSDHRDRDPDRDLYKVLQVDSEADPEVIQAAYRRLAQKFHPDVAPGPEAAGRMSVINRAWAILRVPAERAAYDRRRRASIAAATAAQPPAQTHAPSASPRSARSRHEPRRPEAVSSDWTSGRSTIGGGYDPASMRAPDGHAAAGPPPGNASGSVLNFGRYAGWSLGEIARTDLEYVEWLDRMPIGRSYRDEIDGILRRAGRRRSAHAEAADQRGLFRRR